MVCPSSQCKTGAQLLGIRQNDGTIAILPQTLPVDTQFITNVKKDPTPAIQRFRFTNKCVENGCKQWNGKACGVVEEVVNYLNQIPSAEMLPSCPIRTNCRWFHQKGAEACKICIHVVTEITQEELNAI